MVNNRIIYTIGMTSIAIMLALAGCSAIDNSKGDNNDRSIRDSNVTDSHDVTISNGSTGTNNSSNDYNGSKSVEVNVELHKNNVTGINQGSASGKRAPNGDIDVVGVYGCLKPDTKIVVEASSGSVVSVEEYSEDMATGKKYVGVFKVIDASPNTKVTVYVSWGLDKQVINSATL